ncbi:nuclease-related domain-containing protein [Arsukibacterium ikkense]|uniref:nuclease-related domain-containing protein n=1 Tax=Arsukibacterium ikkense TaxID=336831 RepID=UPI0013792E5D|nr:nuclease-related domain-containing protein [Arsukibacterium ikkense]
MIPLLLLMCAQAFAQQQYTEGACILLDQQIQRFSHQPQSSNYRNAKNEYERYCRKPNPVVPREPTARPAPVPAETTVPAPQQSSGSNQQAKPELPAEQIAVPAQVAELLLAEPTVEPELATEIADTATAEVAVPTVSEPSRIVVPAAGVSVQIDDAASADTEFSVDKLISQFLNYLPLIIANIFALLLAVFLLTNWLGLNLPGFKGIFAEYKLNRLLRWRLARGYRHFRKLKLLTAKEELVVVDHLVLSPFGIFVIMVKGYRGSIFGDVAEANWLRQYFGAKKQFMNPLHQNFKNMEAVKYHLELHGTPLAQHVHSVIAFSRVAQFKTEMPANVTYVDTTSTYLKKFEEPCFDDEQLNRFAALLRQASTAN